MLTYQIEGGNLPVVICSQRGSMSWMSPNMHMDTSTAVAFPQKSEFHRKTPMHLHRSFSVKSPLCDGTAAKTC